jgi:uncharacterized protein
MFPFFYDPTFALILPALAFAFWAQRKVKSAYREYSEVYTRSRTTGAQVARAILNGNGMSDVAVNPVAGELSDHYNPADRTVNLSEGIYGQTSIASLAIAAHECGHALQHKQGYKAMEWRAKLVPAANIGSWAAFPLFFVGMFIGKSTGVLIMDIGIGLFAAALMFHLVTLPVEFDASRRALAVLEGSQFLARDEMDGARKVLRAAAFTYVASATMAATQLIRLLILRNMADD